MSNPKAKVYNDAKIWQIGFFSLNNTATNLALFIMMQYSYFSQNVLGLAAAIIGVIATSTRVFDAITDPIIGFMVDKTNTKFGKLRPYMLTGCIIIWICIFFIFTTPPEWSISKKYIYTSVFYFLYIIGYTCQTVVTKAGQSVLTNNPKKRPFFSGFDGVFTQLAAALVPLLITTILADKYSVGEYAAVDGGKGLGMLNPAMWKEAVLIVGGVSIFITILAIIGISEKDKPENFKDTQVVSNIKFSNYLDIIKGNRPLQMLIIAAATDKLGLLLMNGTMTYVFANLVLDVKLQGIYSSSLVIPIIIMSFIGVGIGSRFGLKKQFLISTWGSMIVLIIMFVLRPNPEAPMIFITLMIVQKCIASIANSAVIPMIADCTDYEKYRSDNFVPGMIGTLFSFVDKMVSSFQGLILGFALTLAGVGNVIIEPNKPVNESFNLAIMICFCIVPLLGHVASVISMKFYTLDATEMEKIQKELKSR